MCFMIRPDATRAGQEPLLSGALFSAFQALPGDRCADLRLRCCVPTVGRRKGLPIKPKLLTYVDYCGTMCLQR